MIEVASGRVRLNKVGSGVFALTHASDEARLTEIGIVWKTGKVWECEDGATFKTARDAAKYVADTFAF